ncbi:hypothetical protein QAD02_014347 [Eretmocerus hayati]|uniref:Uncharacterized protein n=1 Tax=Eretmocerus hayati TaxID=131215 RepID=A0ACC2P5A1_9HYME|nr:hypothetical protein QAD02_014347 [Eretmocerus hayati]
MKIADVLFVVIVILSVLLYHGHSIVFEGIAVGVAVIGYFNRCKFYECCNDEMIPRNTARLKQDLQSKLYGQHIAQEIVLSAIHSHVYHNQPRKPLVLSFHGVPGSGKNYVATMVAKALFKSGEQSAYYHFFNGRSDFPSETSINIYRYDLKTKIQRALEKCERSLFVFDEVDKMPEGILDILVPFLDYTSWLGREKTKSIFIFLSNTGSDLIVKRMIDLWKSGKRREETTLQDFESLVALGAFNEKGGLHRSGAIESKLIDHHVPFLPMEEKHVIQCLTDVFKHWNIYSPSEEVISQALSHVSYGPSPYNLYSTAGCKKLDHKVSSIVFKDQFNELEI